MDQQQFISLLQGVQIPDTERVKAATTELRKTYYPNPESLLWLIEIFISHGDQATRQQAAVEAQRLVTKHWKHISDAQKQQIREQLLQKTLNEEVKLVRHSGARVIAAIASEDIEEGQWANLPDTLAQAAGSPQVSHREVGVYILFTLLDTAPNYFSEQTAVLFSILGKTIHDQESTDVRINTLVCLGAVCGMIEPDEDPESVKLFLEIFPQMVSVLKNFIDAKEEERTVQAFEVFQTLLGCESALIGPHFKDLANFMLEIAADTNNESDTRTLALSFLNQCTRYRKVKVQGTKDLGEKITMTCMQIVTELEEDDDEDDEDSPARAALALLNLLAESLPPRQVIVPLLNVLPQFASHQDPRYRQAGILSLGWCVEGAPDFVGTQMESFLPIFFKLLEDPESGVRHAALVSLARLADDLAEDLQKAHEHLIPALLKNLDAAMQHAAAGNNDKQTLNTMKASCGALDSLTEGMDQEIVKHYLPTLVPRLTQLLDHPEISVKSSAASAIGSLASSSEQEFLPFFKDTIDKLAQFVELKSNNDELDLRATVCDSIGSMAAAVGPQVFEPYVKPLMHATEEALHLDHPRLKETSYLLWGILAKVYEEEFTPFLGGVVTALAACLAQPEDDLEVQLGEHAQELLGQEVMVAGKKVKVAGPTDIEDVDVMYDDEDEEWDDITAVTAVALEKEVAIEVIGDILTHTRQHYMPYFAKTIEAVTPLVEHSYEGVRKTAISTMWRAYACLFSMMEDKTGTKWAPGLPLAVQPTSELIKMGEIVTTATINLWENEFDRGVITDINRNVSSTLKLCGPAILAQPNFAEAVKNAIDAIVTRQHPCQQDMIDSPDEDDSESSEYDWLVIDTVLDLTSNFALALGSQFGEIFKEFEKPLKKFASSNTPYERSAAIGVIAEITAHMGSAVTPFTSSLLPVLLKRLSDPDAECKSNAAYGIGLLIFHSQDSGAYLSSYNTILGKLEPLLQTNHARSIDNACGCVSRMIMAHQDAVPLEDILPVMAGLLPLKEDYEENEPIFEMIAGLYSQSNQTILQLTPKLIPVFAAVLGEPADQLEVGTREKVKGVVKFIGGSHPELLNGYEALQKL
ncbi:hypothetical protein DSL72_007248 [Monilinia vaccinii-corymbosi]|uniref:Importin N-terminal domain-containing protein n=1 Tax=Monilinia vaccinii-corymbosi TaxID=61207 RepID=A0A8A3PM99_9HELO|nr:hypothetical protein DSL72_007248 [Monilinia vaccinii-corymbosi]